MLRYLTAGESHGPALTAIVEGFPSGDRRSTRVHQPRTRRRQGGYGRGKRQTLETDRIIVESGTYHGVTTGAPITLRLINNDAKLERLQEPASPPGGPRRPGRLDQLPDRDPPGPRTRQRPGDGDPGGRRGARPAPAPRGGDRASSATSARSAGSSAPTWPEVAFDQADPRRQPGLHPQPLGADGAITPRSTRPRRRATPWAGWSRRSPWAARSAWGAMPSGTASSTPGSPWR